ncbi:MAG: hypothetical protein HY828_17280 [Actinobacteria bacterium]|nr:hypothetical protein [Actinomycetota bacterium]
MHASNSFAPSAPTVMVVPWADPLIDHSGHEVRSQYVELFWLNILGPSATWALRRLVAGLDRYPLGYELDLDETANELGLSYSTSTSNTFVKALQRCVLFGVAQPVPDGLAVRRRLPTVSMRHLSRMPAGLQARHAQWTVRRASLPDLERGRALASVMLATGDEPEVVERQLLALGVSPEAAVLAASGTALTS